MILLLALLASPQFPVFPAAQGAEPEVASPVQDYVTPEITVLGPTSADKRSVNDYVPTVSELSGLKLNRRKQATLGETLSREAGVSSSYFGPNASRPVIRGLEGERIRILQNGIGTLDASGTSPDHAVSLDPFLIDRVEIVRGSAALLYGNSAVGGVVNTVNGRIPDRLQFDELLKLDLRGSSVDAQRAGGAILHGSAGRFAFHLDGVFRRTNNYKIPDFARSEPLRAQTPLAAGENEMRSRVDNSASETLDGALGASYVTELGYLGASFAGYRTQYGTVAEPDVTIDLNRQRVDVSGERRELGPIEALRFKGAVSHYRHQELNKGAIGTTFRNRGAEARIDARHVPVAKGIAGSSGLAGTIGAQTQYFDFSAAGDEAFLPTTHNSSIAMFAYEELPIGDWTPSLGARVDRSAVESIESASFGPGRTQTYWSPSVSLGALYKLHPEYSFALNASFTERAPNYQELFANGPHIATGIHEIGDRGLSQELSRSAELSLRHKTTVAEGRVSFFVQDFSRFIALAPRGVNDATSGLAIYDYAPIEATLFGAEVEYRRQLPWRVWKGVFEIEARFDWVRGRDRTHRANLPRMTPVRESIGLAYQTSAFTIEAEVQRSEAQGLVAQGELPTSSYTMLNLGLEVPFATSFGTFRAIARANNLNDVDARTHVSFLKDRAPLPGRNFLLGLQAVL